MVIKFGCHGYTWQMSYETQSDNLLHILDVIQKGGFKGLDTQVVMLGSFYHEPLRLKEELEKRGLELAALTLSLHWRHPIETEAERNDADYFINYLKHFPNALMNIVPLPEDNRDCLEERQQNILKCVNAIGQRAYDQGVVASFHPNSSPGSVFQNEEDYQVMFAGLDTRVIGYTPDAGHIAKGGMDVYKIFEENRALIKHIHFKDMLPNKEWTAMGNGMIDFPKIVQMLHETDYDGWIMVEEESAEAVKDPDGAMVENSKYVEKQLKSICHNSIQL
ncbi:sugar phosphate isomerase/epimerase [Bacillus sp. FJAT-50079]|uniref:sugar phosphate isomerase/epimerase family protein n=1 Tax=Bacillus sp. FJAT-50079 TaxID=2833577 RepID=UPI001BC95572|nr:sugar phosphate isomerase/epimerase [Bacillus sp. FJAT-50079]MBS4208146.1 sugar phosphate isomerase/epimerase [Bacillus sp. FJAT-50079]